MWLHRCNDVFVPIIPSCVEGEKSALEYAQPRNGCPPTDCTIAEYIDATQSKESVTQTNHHITLLKWRCSLETSVNIAYSPTNSLQPKHFERALKETWTDSTNTPPELTVSISNRLRIARDCMFGEKSISFYHCHTTIKSSSLVTSARSHHLIRTNNSCEL